MPNLPSVSVVIPAHNESHHIAATVRAIKNQEYPSDKLSIFVVDNNSTDGTAKIAAENGATIIPCPHGKVGAVRNLGARQNQSEIIAFIDGDCEASTPRWLQAAVQILEDPTIGAVGGPARLPTKTSWVERAFVGPQSSQSGDVARLAGSSFIVRRKDFELVGGFSEVLSAGEDDELSARIRAQNLRIFSSDNCSIVHNDYPKTLRQIFRKQLWHARDQLEAADSWQEPMLVLTHIFTLALMGTILGALTIPQSGPWIALTSLLLALIVANALALIKTFRNGGGISRVLPLTIVNLSYLTARSWALVLNYRRRLLK